MMIENTDKYKILKIINAISDYNKYKLKLADLAIEELIENAISFQEITNKCQKILDEHNDKIYELILKMEIE